MLPPPFQNALVLTGPTGSGKTQLGLEMAPRLDAEIIAMDSMTVYRGMDIGTAKPTLAERTSVPHHLIDVLDPWQSASVAWWLAEAAHRCRDIEARGKQVLFVGGTPLYLKALCAGLFEGPPADEAIRRRLMEEARTFGSAALHERLAAVDPWCSQRIHPNDVRRMIRALEVYELTHKPMSAWQTQWTAAQEPGNAPTEVSVPAIVCLNPPREELYERINQRVLAMFAAGWVEEVEQLRSAAQPLSREAEKALGYAEILALLQGRMTRAEALVRIQMRSRHFAKRQMTWFRHLPHCLPIREELTPTLWQSKMKR